MFRFLAFSFLIFNSSGAYSQMVTSSIFPEMRAINPAVIGKRESATFAAVAQKVKSEKKQDLSTGSTFSAGSNTTETVNINTINGFYGGKGGGTFTTELIVDILNGSQDYEAELPNSTQTELSSEVDANSALYSLGFGIGEHFGVSIAQNILKVDSTFKTSLTPGGGGSAININMKSETTITTSRLRAGFRMTGFGAYFERRMDETESKTTPADQNMPDGTTDTSKNVVGLGTGITSKTFHLEAFYEKELADVTVQNKTYSPSRFGFTVEKHFGGLALGYTGLYLMQGFSDLEKEIYNNLIYGGLAGYEDRLEHIINFSFGSSKGASFGGSAFYSSSETQEVSDLDSENLYKTETTAMGLALKFTYAY